MTDEYPIYVLSRHESTGDTLDDGHPCCICSDRDEVRERNSTPKVRVNPPVYGYEVAKYVGYENATKENRSTAWGQPHEFAETVAGGPSREAMVAYLRLIGAERVQDFTYKGATWDKPSKHWRDL